MTKITKQKWEKMITEMEEIKEKSKFLKEGMRIKVRQPFSKQDGEEGYLIKIQKDYCPDAIVLLDKYKNLIPELAFRYCWLETLEQI